MMEDQIKYKTLGHMFQMNPYTVGRDYYTNRF